MITPETFREGLIEALQLAQSARQIREYKARVPIADVVAEVFCIWEDLYHPSVPTFEVAFQAHERQALAAYEAACSAIAIEIGQIGVEEFLSTSQWRTLAAAAKEALEALGVDGEDAR